MTTKKKPVRTSSPTMKRIVAALKEHGRLTALEIAEKAFCGLETFTIEYRPILVKEGLIHVCDHIKNAQGTPTPVYAAGNRPSAQKPDRFTQKELTARWKAKPNWMDGRKKRQAVQQFTNPLLAILGLKPQRKSPVVKKSLITASDSKG